jgi:hypothetical protein
MGPSGTLHRRTESLTQDQAARDEDSFCCWCSVHAHTLWDLTLQARAKVLEVEAYEDGEVTFELLDYNISVQPSHTLAVRRTISESAVPGLELIGTTSLTMIGFVIPQGADLPRASARLSMSQVPVSLPSTTDALAMRGLS